MITLINLIGEQSAPNFIAARQYNADKIINVCSDRTAGVSVNLKKTYGEQYFEEDIQVNDPFDINDIKKSLGKIAVTDKNQYIFNFTGGTKPMSIALFQEFFPKNIKGIYVDNQNNRILEYFGDGIISRDIDCKITIEQHFKMYGHNIKEKNLKEDRRNKETKEKLKYFLKENYSQLKTFISDFAEAYNRDKDYFKSDKEFSQKNSDNIVKWTKEGKILEINILGNNFVLYGNSSHKYFTGFWFEELVREKFEGIKLFDEVIFNLEIPKKVNQSESEAEFDIVAAKNHNLYIFEVKSGTFLKDYIHKIASNKNFLSNIFAKMFFITFEELDRNKNEELIRFLRIKNLSYQNLDENKLINVM
jgi:hypothetical protein